MNEDEMFSDADIPASNWFKFEHVGDSVQGQLVSVEFKKSNNAAYPDQRVFGLKQKDGTVIMVGISVNKQYVIGRTNNINLAEHDYKIKFEFKKEVPSTLGKGAHPAKSIEVYVKVLPKALENEQF